MNKKKKPTVSPEAAKILERYRNAGKPQLPAEEGGVAPPPAENGAPARPQTPTPAANKPIHRSGNRGK